MKNKAFDKLARRAAQEEVFVMSKWSESRLAQALNAPVSPRRARRITARVALTAALVIVLLCVAALAAVTWGTRDMVHVPDKEKGSVPNENIVPYIQPVERVFESDVLRVEVIDALYDGNALAIAWTIQNKLDRTLYILSDPLLVDGNYPGQGSGFNVDELFIEPGEVKNCGFVQEIVNGAMGETCSFDIHYVALLPTGEVVRIPSMKDDEDLDAYIANIDALIAEGKVVVAPDGVIELGSHGRRRLDGDTGSSLLVEAGLMERVGALDVSLTLERAGRTLTGLADGMPVEAAFDGYTLRVTKCEISPLFAYLEMECVFQSLQAFERFKPYYEGKHDPIWSFAVLADGEKRWASNSGWGFADKIEEQPDGSVVWRYTFQALEPYFAPKTLTITAQRDVDGEYNVPFPDESLTLTLSEVQ